MSNKFYVEALREAWEANRVPIDPERPPSLFARGFRAGLTIADRIDDDHKLHRMLKDTGTDDEGKF